MTRPHTLVSLFLAVVLCAKVSEQVAHADAPDECSRDVISELCQVATPGNDSVDLHCNIDFNKLDCRSVGLPNTITKRLRFSGNQASNITVDLAGAHIDAGVGTLNYKRGDIVEFVSSATNNERWSVPENIVFKNAHITGSLRLYGLGKNGEAPLVRASSYTEHHVDTLRTNAPNHINLENLEIIGLGRTPLYFAPGVHHVSLSNSTIGGKSVRVGIYLDAESTENVIRDNTISVKTNDGSFLGFYDRGWPQIALDASSRNIVQNNRFDFLMQGGIYLYRNCGEGGTIRHGTSSLNVITGNDFIYQLTSESGPVANPGVLIGSRDYGSFENSMPGTHCDDDEAAGLKVGSAISNRDFATENTVTGNRVQLHQRVGMPSVPAGYSLSERLRIRNPKVNKNNTMQDNSLLIYRAKYAESKG